MTNGAIPTTAPNQLKLKNMMYYSTNPNLVTIHKIREDRRSKLNSTLKEWNEMDKIVSENWEQLYYNALLLEGQTLKLGFNIQVVEADYYAPQRVWIHFHTPERTISIEFHKTQLLKKINGVKINDTRKILKFTNELSFAKRALEILL